MLLLTLFLSVITAVRDGADTIGRTIDSVERLRRSFEVEHVIVEGGSTDGTKELLDSRRAQIDQLLHDGGAGISAAFNLGIDAARGHFICILNSDDYLSFPGVELAFHTIARRAQEDVIYFANVCLLDAHGRISEKRSARLSSMGQFMSLYHPCMLVPREVYRQIGTYDLDYHLAMDAEFVHRALARGVSFEHVPHEMACMSLGGISHRLILRALNEFRRSAVDHAMVSRGVAYYYQLRQSAAHLVLGAPYLRRAYLQARAQR